MLSDLSEMLSLSSEILSDFFEPFDLSYCSESKLFNAFKKLTVKIGVPKWLIGVPKSLVYLNDKHFTT